MSTNTQKTEEALTWFGVALATTARIIEAGAIGLATVFVAPPLVTLAFVVVVSLLVRGAVAAVLAVPVIAFRRVHRHRVEHPHELVQRVAAWAREKRYA
jgi:hypothetical protein